MIQTIPSDIQDHIAGFLDAKSLVSLGVASKDMNNLVKPRVDRICDAMLAAEDIAEDHIREWRMKNHKQLATHGVFYAGKPFAKLVHDWAGRTGHDLTEGGLLFSNRDVGTSWSNYHSARAVLGSKRIPTCSICDDQCKVHLIDDIWASCECVGGNGLTTNLH